MAQKRRGDKPQKTRGSELLKKWRGKSRSQTAVGYLLGLDMSRVSAFETGRMRPGMDVAARIAEATDNAVPVTAWLEPAKRAA